MIFRGKLAVSFREGNSQIKYSDVFCILSCCFGGPFRSPSTNGLAWWFGAFGGLEIRLDPQKWNRLLLIVATLESKSPS